MGSKEEGRVRERGEGGVDARILSVEKLVPLLDAGCDPKQGNPLPDNGSSGADNSLFRAVRAPVSAEIYP